MHSESISFFGVFLLAFLGLLLLAGLALFIYSIVTKRYWLMALLLLLPIGLVLVPSFFIVLNRAAMVKEHEQQWLEENQAASREQNFLRSEIARPTVQGTIERVSDHPTVDQAWSDELPPTADIYPSWDLCGRPLAYQIAESIASESEDQKKFAVTFAKGKRHNNHDPWQPSKAFVDGFKKEFLKHFPGSTVGETITKAEANSAEAERESLKIKLTFKEATRGSDLQTPGTVSAKWTTSRNTRGVASTNFLWKDWVTDPAKYLADKRKQNRYIGFSPRLARSPEEAIVSAFNNLSSHQPPDGPPDYDLKGRVIARRPQKPSRATPNQIVEQFVQKIVLPYGELWQGSVLVDQGIRSDLSSSIKFRRDDGYIESLRPDARFPNLTPSSALILIASGLIAIGLLSNLLTQGYYRQNITYTVVTGVAVVLGLLILAMLLMH